MRLCTVDGCASKHYAKGFCNRHWMRWRAHGDNFPREELRVANGLGLKFLEANVGHIGKVDCIIWPYSICAFGYGTVSFRGRTRFASRAMCMLAHGDPPFANADAAHSCGNRACVNPNHLRWASRYENVQDAWEHGTAVNGERVGTSKLTEEQALAIYRSEKSVRELADEYDMSLKGIRKIKSGGSWAWLTGHGRAEAA